MHLVFWQSDLGKMGNVHLAKIADLTLFHRYIHIGEGPSVKALLHH